MNSVNLQDIIVDDSIISKLFWPCDPPDVRRCANRCCTIGCLLTSKEIEQIREHLDGIMAHMRLVSIRRLRRSGFYYKLQKPTQWDLNAGDEQGYKTRVVDRWCMFFTGQVSGAGCALQVYALARGMHPWALKPRDGWLFPIRPISRRRLYVSDNWPLPCLEDQNNEGAPPIYVACRAELVHLLGEGGYADLVKLAESVESAKHPADKGKGV